MKLKNQLPKKFLNEDDAYRISNSAWKLFHTLEDNIHNLDTSMRKYTADDVETDFNSVLSTLGELAKELKIQTRTKKKKSAFDASDVPFYKNNTQQAHGDNWKGY